MPARPRSGSTLAELCAFLQRDADERRRRVARALHDSPAQTVSAALLTLFLLEREKGVLSAGAQRALQDAQTLLASCGDELRQISHDLHPPLLDEVGLAPPLRALARRAGGGRVHLHIAEVSRPLRGVEEAAYRFAEQALDQVLAARGRAVLDLRPDESGKGVSLVIEGVARKAGPGRALALLALEQRVSGAGGTLVTRLRKNRIQLEAHFRKRGGGGGGGKARAAVRSVVPRSQLGKIAAPGVSGDRGTAPTGGSVKRQRLQERG